MNAAGRKIIFISALFFLFYPCSSWQSPVPHTSPSARIAELSNNGDFSAALNACKRLADSGSLSGYLNMATILKDLCHHDLAIRLLARARGKFGDDPGILSLLARLYYLNNQPDEAIRILIDLSRTRAEDREVQVTLGLCYDAKGDDVKAQEYFQKALALDRNDVVARLSLAEVYRRQNRLEDSVREYKAASLIDSSIQMIYGLWAEALYLLGNIKEAFSVYEKAISFEPHNLTMQQRLDEIRERLGQEYFAQQKARRVAAKKKKKVLVEPFRKVEDMTFVRIGLLETHKPVELKCSTAFVIKIERDNAVLATYRDDTHVTARCGGAGELIFSDEKQENFMANETVIIEPVEPEGTITVFDVAYGADNFWANVSDRSYRGKLRISAAGANVRVVNILNLEEYLYGVVPSEMPAGWPLEALKAQAVAARSETLAKIGRHKASGYDLCAEVHCQVYSGVGRETAQTNLAVDQTMGMILEHRGKPVDAVYSASCGGHTQDNIFSKRAIPYFTATTDGTLSDVAFPLSPAELEGWLKDPPPGIFCDVPESSRNGAFRWVRQYSADQMRAMTAKVANVGAVMKVIVLQRNISGHIQKVKVVGSNATCILEQELAIRRAFGNLRSSMFKIEVKYGADRVPETFIFYGGGWGHGVGMCQAGACGMARAGKDFKEILQHYYKSAQFKKLY